jgi:hypothetical protein
MLETYFQTKNLHVSFLLNKLQLVSVMWVIGDVLRLRSWRHCYYSSCASLSICVDRIPNFWNWNKCASKHQLPFEICMYISWFHRKLECDVQNDVLYAKCLSNYIEGDKKELRANTIALEASRFAFSSFIVQESFWEWRSQQFTMRPPVLAPSDFQWQLDDRSVGIGWITESLQS